MHILEVNTEKTWRGGERQTYYNIQGFLDEGLKVDLLCKKGYPLSKKAVELKIPIHQISASLGCWLWLALHGKKYDIIHVQTAKTQSLAILAKPFYGRPIVYTRRSNFLPKTGIFSKFKYERTDRLSANSYHIGEVLADYGIRNPVTVLREIVEEEELNRQRAEDLVQKLGLGEKKILATAGALVDHKDPINMVQAIKKLHQQRQDFVFLHFGDGELRKKVEDEIARESLGDVFQLMGFQENMQDFYSIFDLFVMSSSGEGTPNTILDAFLYKVPVVATRAGGTEEILKDKGILCPIQDSTALAQGMDSLLNQPELAREYTQKAYQYVGDHHSLKKVTKDYIKVFQDLLDSGHKT